VDHGDPARFRATVHYAGSAFAGWQAQPDHRTVQGTIEELLGKLFDVPVRIAAAGRTDTGVHATGQEIAFEAPARWNAVDLRRALTSVLPADIWIETARPTSQDFHPRFSATGRRYEYYIGTEEEACSPVRAGRIWQLGKPVDDESLRLSAELTVGERSFGRLSKAGQPDRGTVCTVESADWARTPLGDLRLAIIADRFLHRMVRYLVATMVDVATGRRGQDELRDLISESGDVRAPEPAPAAGLYLTGVRYGDGWNRSEGVPGLWPSSDGRSEGTMKQ
jgi:tRNA pseudouridine38-40 synthase